MIEEVALEMMRSVRVLKLGKELGFFFIAKPDDKVVMNTEDWAFEKGRIGRYQINGLSPVGHNFLIFRQGAPSGAAAIDQRIYPHFIEPIFKGFGWKRGVAQI